MAINFSSMSPRELKTLVAGGLSPSDRAALDAYMKANPEVRRQLGIAGLTRDYGENRFSNGALNTYLPDGDAAARQPTSAGSREIARMALRGTTGAALETKWQAHVADVASRGGPVDVNDLVQAVLREAYMANTEDLRFFATKVKFYNDLKKQIRDELTRARDAFAKTAGGTEATVLENAFFGRNFETAYMGREEVMEATSGVTWGTVDAAFSTAFFNGDRAAAGSAVDPLAIRLGDGPAVVDTPNGAFVVSGRWVTGPTFRSTGAENFTDSGGLWGLAGQIHALTSNPRSENAKFVPDPRAPRNPDGTWGYWDGQRPPPTREEIFQWVRGEVDAGRIAVSGWVREHMNLPPEQQTAGVLNVTLQYYEENRTTTWFGPDMGIIVHDLDGNGQIAGNELFGDKAMTGRDVANGYEDLARYDVNKDGLITAADGDNFKSLSVWMDRNSNGKVDAGELRSLLAAGVTEINTQIEGGATGETGVLYTSSAQGTDIVTRADLDAYIKGMEEKLNSVGDDAQLANVDLQNMLQKQQQTLQMMSNISKMLHDTAMAVVRKIGG